MNQARLTVFAVVVVFSAVLGGCASGRWERLSLPPLPEGDPDPFHLLLDETKIVFREDGAAGAVAEVTERRRIRYLKASAEQLSAAHAAYWHPFIEVVSLRGRAVSSSGEAEEADPAKGYDLAAVSDGLLYQDSRFRYLPLPPTDEGGVHETESVRRYRELPLFQHGHYMGFFAGRTHRTVLEARAPRGWEIEWVDRCGHPALSHSKAEEGGQTVWRFEAKDLPAAESEPLGQGGCLGPELRVRLLKWQEGGVEKTAFKTPRELSKWEHELTRSSLQVDDELRALSAKIAPSGTERERARKLYDFAVSEIRYCYVHNGYGAWKPHASTETLKTRYGDCKDKANFLRALLYANGIESRLATIYSHDGLPKPFTLPTLAGNFNHMILIVDLPDGPVIADPTTRTVPFGELPANDLEADILPLSEAGDDLIKSPAAPPEVVLERSALNLTLHASGHAAGDYRTVRRGADAHGLRYRLLTQAPAKWDESVGSFAPLYSAKAKGAAVDGKISELDSALSLSAQVSVERFADRAGTLLVVKPADVLRTWMPSLAPGARRQPVVHPTRGTRELVANVKLPAGAKLAKIPDPVEVESAFGTYRLAVTEAGGTVSISRRFTLKERIIQPAAYAEYLKFNERVRAAEAVPLVLELP